MPEILQPAPEIRNRRGLFMVAFCFAGQGTRPPVRQEEKDEKKVGVSGFEPGTLWIRTWNPACRGGPRVLGTRKEGRSASPTLVPPAWGVPAWRGWAHCAALVWCFPHCSPQRSESLSEDSECWETGRESDEAMGAIAQHATLRVQ